MNKTHELLAALDEEIETAPPSQLAAICGHLEALKVKAFARAMAPSPQPHSDDNNAEDRLLTVDEVAKRLGQKAQWVRDHQDKLNSRVTLPGAFGALLRKTAQRVHPPPRVWLDFTAFQFYGNMATMKAPPRGVKMTVEVPPELFDAAKIRAIKEKTNLRTVVIAALSKYLGAKR